MGLGNSDWSSAYFNVAGNKSNNFKRFMINQEQYELYFLNKTIEELTSGYDKIEEQIQHDIIQKILKRLTEVNAEIKGEILLINKLPFQVTFYFDNSTRTFVINIILSLPACEDKFNTEDIPINGIGYIKKLQFNFSSKLKIDRLKLMNEVSQIVKLAYLSIEISLKSRIKNLEHDIIRNLYELFDIQLIKHTANPAIGEYWFSITKLSKSFNPNDSFSFYFNIKYLNLLIDKLKSEQYDLISPIEMIFSMIFTDAPDDGLTFYKEKKDKRVDLVFNEMVKMTSEFHEFWFTQKALIREGAFSFNYLHVYKGYLLAINYPNSFKDIIELTINDSKDAIKSEFEKNVNYLSKKLSLKDKYSKIKGNSKIWEEVKDWTTTIIAKLGAEMMK